MIYGLFRPKPLPEPMLPYCQLDPYEQTSVKIELKYKNCNSWKCIWKCCQWNINHFVWGEMIKLIIEDPYQLSMACQNQNSTSLEAKGF